jgi:hypothetical protein
MRRYFGILDTGGWITLKCILITNGLRRHGLDSTEARQTWYPPVPSVEQTWYPLVPSVEQLKVFKQ